MKLYSFFRSSAAFRTRIALNLKGLPHDMEFIHLRKNEQSAPAYVKVNPLGLVPTLIDGPNVLAQSLAIIEYLDETHPSPPLLPKDPLGRARARAIALTVACEIHPLNNLRVLVYLKKVMKVSDAAHDEWYRHWIAEGFKPLEEMLKQKETGTFCHGDTPTLADICLVPQVFNAMRYNTEAELRVAYPTIFRVFDNCMKIDAFQKATPENQGDRE